MGADCCQVAALFHCRQVRPEHKSIGKFFPSMFWLCWLGLRKGIRPVKSWALVRWRWWVDWSFGRLIAPVVTTTSIILSSNKIRNEDILVPAYPGCCGKWLLNEHTLGWLNNNSYQDNCDMNLPHLISAWKKKRFWGFWNVALVEVTWEFPGEHIRWINNLTL